MMPDTDSQRYYKNIIVEKHFVLIVSLKFE